MPTYDRKCDSCLGVWETMEPIEPLSPSDPHFPTCPKCGSKSSQRIISGKTAFVLKGSGWAKDGYSS